jgi:Zn-dependent protease
VEHLYILPVLLFSIVVHEVAHGWMALRLGDTTARDMGRLTLNPIPHIDPIGSILIPLLSYLSVGSVFIAWAKPVPIDPRNFRNFRRDDILVSIAGPVSNLIMAGVCTICYIVVVRFLAPMESLHGDLQQSLTTFVIQMFSTGITLNIVLAVFNMIPVPPLDGSHVLSAVLPEQIRENYQRIGFFGVLIVIVLMRLEPIRNILWSVVLVFHIPYDLLLQLFLK